jgi:Protein of unknown function (DUF4232)
MRVEQLEESLQELVAGQPPVSDGRDGLRRRTRRRRRRQIVGAALATVVMVGAVLVWQPWASPRAALDVTAGPQPSTDTNPLETGGSTPAISIPAGTAPCRGHQLGVVNGSQGESQTTLIGVRFSNQTTVPCVLEGIPTGVELVAANGAVLAVDVNTAPYATLSGVLMQPGVTQAATLGLDWANWCGQPPTSQLQLRFTLAETGDTLTTPLNGPTDGTKKTNPIPPNCIQPGQPSTLTIIYAYQAN